MAHGLLKWAKDGRGLQSAICECGWFTAPAWKTSGNTEAQIEMLRRHVVSKWA